MNKFADYFVICGLDINSGLEPDRYAGDNLHVSPLDRAYKCKILGHYPQNVAHNPFDPSAVSMLCLPNGLRFRTQKHSVTQAPIFHSFLITRENGKRCYGFSLVFYEEIRNRDICAAMQTLQAMYITELSSELPVIQHLQNSSPQSRSLPRHFKLSTPKPSGAALAYYDITKDKLFVSKSIAIICQHGYVHAARIFLENLYRCVPKKTQNNQGLSIESYVFNVIYEVDLIDPGKSLLLYLPPSDPLLPLSTVVLQNPAPSVELPHLDYSIKLMFMWLGVDIILQLFTCLLMENQVLLRCSDCQRLMVVCEAITSLLFPFTWPHVYVPILPASLHHFLDAPVPFLMGLYASTDNIKVASEASLCYIDVDKGKIQLPEETATFPHFDSFSAEIWSTLDKHNVRLPNVDPTKFLSDSNNTKSCTLPGRPLNRRKHSIHDILDGERPPSPPGSARTEALQRIADIVRRTGVNLDQNETTNTPIDSYLEDLRFNNSIREVFLNRFVHMFLYYENFVIFPQNADKEDWFNNRESMQNFDKASFLSDQPDQHRQFLWRFLESQMFATLIDNKILSTWGEVDNNLQIFDNRIKLLKERHGGENLYRSLCYEPCTVALDTQKLIEKRFYNPDFESSRPKEIMCVKKMMAKHFPILDKDILNKTPVTSKGSIPRAGSVPSSSLTINNKNSVFEKGNHTNSPTAKPDLSPALIAQANWTFVEKLLKDCKTKTKRMFLAKMGAEGVTLSTSNNSNIDHFGAVEENTLVASFCDFLERVWSHGLTRKRGKSALWSHLLAYQEAHKSNEHALLNKYISGQQIENLVPNIEVNHVKSVGDLPPLPNSLLFDIKNVQAMSDVKAAIGMARAWIRLSLEKKHLSKHLGTLLSDQNVLKTFYKRTAFLRCDEEKEQFLYHILSLNAVDYFCFTSTYPTIVIPYRIVIIPSKKGTFTSANLWIVLSGTLSETRRINVPKSTLNIEHKNQNIGVLTTLRIGHDNTGSSAKWMIDSVIVRNEITGHTYKFPCGRWLGKGVDDGSTERLLIGNLLPIQLDGDEAIIQLSTGGNTSITGQITPKSHSPASTLQRTNNIDLKPSQIQHMLGDCVNNIVKWNYRRTSDKRTTLTVLLCGENGLVHCLELVFLMGFRATKLFVCKHYLWDFLVRVKEQFELELQQKRLNSSRSSSTERTHQETVAVWRCYCHLIDEIQNSSSALGKDGKFQLFICLSVREHLLHRMLVPIAMCKITFDMYEEKSFLRNRGLLTFLRQILLPLDDLDVVLENSVTHGISSPSSVQMT